MTGTILLIEDDARSIQLMKLLLEAEGYDTKVAQNGLEGLEMARANPPDLIVLDLMLPGMDGFEVLRQIRSEPSTKDIPVVITSAKSQLTDMETANKLGVDAYLTKPFRRADLATKLHALLRENV